MRESYNQQDTEVSPSEMAVQTRPSRSTLKAIQVHPVMPSVIERLIVKNHYLHSMPAAPRLCFGVYLGGELLGALVFTSGPRHGYRLLAAAKPQQVSVLARVWLSDDLPPNSESRVVGYCLRWIRKHRMWKLLLSYADPAAHHLGTIYQAGGWMYLGRTQPGSAVIVSGKRLHSRTCSNRYGTSSLRRLGAVGISALRAKEPGKHKYVYLLDPQWKWRLRGKALPYPKTEATTDAS
ncbi:MAG: DNA methyltransferase [Chthonomonadales bacterium]